MFVTNGISVKHLIDLLLEDTGINQKFYNNVQLVFACDTLIMSISYTL